MCDSGIAAAPVLVCLQLGPWARRHLWMDRENLDGLGCMMPQPPARGASTQDLRHQTPLQSKTFKQLFASLNSSMTLCQHVCLEIPAAIEYQA